MDSVAKEQTNVTLPPPLIEAVAEVLQRYGPRRRWMIHAAGLLWFLSLSDEEQTQQLRLVAGADASGEFLELVRAATDKAGGKGGVPKVERGRKPKG